MKTDKDDKDDIFLLSHFDDFCWQRNVLVDKKRKTITSMKAILDGRIDGLCVL